jgi:Na+(H+)/acetate symporter ActP
MVLELARSARFFVRNLPRTLALELLLLAVSAAIGLLAFAAGAALATVTSARTAAFVAAQLLVLGLLWQRLAAWGAMLALYQGLALRRLSR